MGSTTSQLELDPLSIPPIIEGWDQVNQLPLRILRTKVVLLCQTKETLLVIENPFHADECGVPPGLVCKGHGIEIVP